MLEGLWLVPKSAPVLAEVSVGLWQAPIQRVLYVLPDVHSRSVPHLNSVIPRVTLQIRRQEVCLFAASEQLQRPDQRE